MASLERAAATKVAHRRDHDGCGPARRGKSANTFDSDPSFPMERLMLIFILMILILTATLPVEAQQADKGLPEPGTRWVARVASPAGVNTLRLTAVGEDLYKGRPVYRVRVEEGGKEGVLFYDHATANLIAITREGREESERGLGVKSALNSIFLLAHNRWVKKTIL